MGIKDAYEKYHEIVITDDAIEAAVDYSVRYQTDKKLPDKAIDLIDTTAARLKIYTDSPKEISCQRNDIIKTLSRAIKIPEDQLGSEKTITSES